MTWGPLTVLIVGLALELGLGVVICSAIGDYFYKKRLMINNMLADIGKVLEKAAEEMKKKLESKKEEN